MCEMIVFGGKWIETYREAREEFGDENLVWDAGLEWLKRDDECLCHLDMKATAKKLGLTANNQHGGDPFEWQFS